MSILCSADAVSSGSWPILFRVLTLNVAICIVCLHFSSFSLSSVANFPNTEARAPTSAGRAPFLPRAKNDAVYVCGLSVGHGYLLMAVFILIYRSHSYRWAAVVPPIELTILSFEPQDSHVQEKLGIAHSHTFTSIMLLPMYTCTKLKGGPSFTLSFNFVKVQD